MTIYKKNLYHAQELQKRANNKAVKSGSNARDDKIGLNSKYIKIKENRKLEAKFFSPFSVSHPIGNEAYKIKLLKKCGIHNVFYIPLLDHDSAKKGRVDKTTSQRKFVAGDNGREYKVEEIQDSAIYVKEFKSFPSGLC